MLLGNSRVIPLLETQDYVTDADGLILASQYFCAPVDPGLHVQSRIYIARPQRFVYRQHTLQHYCFLFVKRLFSAAGIPKTAMACVLQALRADFIPR